MSTLWALQGQRRLEGIVKIGFTGTRVGMTGRQMDRVDYLLTALEPVEVHHGDCVGADKDFHALARDLCPIVLHPGPPGLLRANCSGGQITSWPEKSYLIRNAEIVDSVDMMIACPRTMKEESRGGTWWTIRRARSKGIPVWVVWPDGSPDPA